MTKREFLVAVKAIEGISEEMVAKADEMIASLDNRSSKPTKAQVENEGFKANILEYLAGVEGAVTAAKVAEDTGIVKGKVVALPARDDIDYEVNEQLIVELYSK